MRIPETVTIFGMLVRVIETDLDDDTAGFYDPKSNTIFLDHTLKRQDKIVTLIHEMTHAVAIRLNWIGSMSKEEIEFVCDHVATVVAENFYLRNRDKRSDRF